MATPQELLAKAKAAGAQVSGNRLARKPLATGGMPPNPKYAGFKPAGRPAWQQLREAGIGGQGSAAANRAKLAELQGGASAGAVLRQPAAYGPSGPREIPDGSTFAEVLEGKPMPLPGFRPAGPRPILPDEPVQGGGMGPQPMLAPEVPQGGMGRDPNMGGAAWPAGGFEALGRLGAQLPRRYGPGKPTPSPREIAEMEMGRAF